MAEKREQPGTDTDDKPPGREAKVQVDPGLTAAGEVADGAHASTRGDKPEKQAATASDRRPKREVSPVADKSSDKTDPAGDGDKADRWAVEEPLGRAASATRHAGLPLWGWILLGLATIVVGLLVADARNRNRHRLACTGKHLELQTGRRMPWPFGFEPVGGAFKRIPIPPEADCRGQRFDNQTEAESTFLDYLIAQAKRALATPDRTDLKRVRTLLQQAMMITRLDLHRGQRKRVDRLMADLSYRQGRAGLARVENELRTALGYLRQAQRLAGDRYDDLDDWVTHLEDLLQTVVPTPGGAPMRLLSPKVSPGLPPPAAGPPSSDPSRSPMDTPPGEIQPPSDAGPAPGQPGRGILM